MTYEIDQSGKIEQTSKNTIICLSNRIIDTVFISAKVKRQLQEIFRRSGMIRNFIYFSFCALIVLILKRNKKIGKVVIDKEYYGHESAIKEIILEMLTGRKPIPVISFTQIGKQSNAHKHAHEVAIKKSKPKKIITFKEIFNLIKKT